MCNLYSVTKGQPAIRDLFSVKRDRAGNLPSPIVGCDPAQMNEDERERLGLRRLPHSLAEALAALAADKDVSGWFTNAFLKTYHGMKRQEIALLDGLDASAMLARYADVY